MLYDLKASEIISDIAEEVMTFGEMTKSQAKKLVLNALVANCVQEEILNQVKFLLENDGYKENLS